MKILHLGFGFRRLRWGGLIGYVEDLLEGQVERGHQVGYAFAGRRYPHMSTPRHKRWARGGVAMFELVNSTLPWGGDLGTRFPDEDLAHAPSEAFLGRVLDEFRPDVLHVQELYGVPSSLLDVARERGYPVVMTLHDYFTLCPTLKLYDAEDGICLRRKPGHMCAVCCRDAPTDAGDIVDGTMRYEQERILVAVPGLAKLPRPDALKRALARVGAAAPDVAPRTAAAPPPPPGPPAPPEAYDRRRDVNVERLSRVDRLLAISNRVGEIYTELGVDPARIEVMHITLAHIDRLRPKVVERVGRPVRFATLAGCASTQKGSQVVLRALDALRREGFGPDDFRLEVRGYVDPSIKDDLAARPEVENRSVYHPSEMQEILDRTDVGIVPSAWEEAYGFVGVEFLAAGVPVIGNALGGIVDYVRPGETGWLNSDSSGRGLAELMASVIRDPGQVPPLNARIRELRPQLVKSLDRHLEELEAVYDAILR